MDQYRHYGLWQYTQYGLWAVHMDSSKGSTDNGQYTCSTMWTIDIIMHVHHEYGLGQYTCTGGSIWTTWSTLYSRVITHYSTLHITHYTLHITHYTLHTTHYSTHNTLQYTLPVYMIHYKLQNALHIIQYTLQYTLQYTCTAGGQYTLRAVHSARGVVQATSCTCIFI